MSKHQEEVIIVEHSHISEHSHRGKRSHIENVVEREPIADIEKGTYISASVDKAETRVDIDYKGSKEELIALTVTMIRRVFTDLGERRMLIDILDEEYVKEKSKAVKKYVTTNEYAMRYMGEN